MSLRFGDQMTILDGLRSTATGSLAATFRALRTGDTSGALDGVASINGEIRPIDTIHAQPVASASNEIVHVPSVEASTETDESSELRELGSLVSALERATALGAAELRGARQVLDDLEDAEPDQPPLPKTQADLDELADTIAALDAALPRADIVSRIDVALTTVDQLAHDAEAADRIVAQAQMSIDRLQPTDAPSVRAGLEEQLNLASADARRAREGATEQHTLLSGAIEQLGLAGDDPVATGRRVLAERLELLRVRARLEEAFHTDLDPHDAASDVVPDADATSLGRGSLERLIDDMQRRLEGHQHLLASAREQWILGYMHGDSALHDAALHRTLAVESAAPAVLLDRPLQDLPESRWSSAADVAVRAARLGQIVVLPSRAGHHVWAERSGADVIHLRAEGWFAEEDAPC